MNDWLENILRFLLVVLLQVVLINNLHFLGICSPCVYLLFLFALPANMPRWVELLIGFATGLVMDMFSNSLGVHTSACTLVSYVRPLLIRNLVQENERLTGSVSGKNLGFAIYTKCVVILTLIHHIVLFNLAAFSLNTWWLTLLQIVVSGIVTIALILLYDILKRNPIR